MNRLYVHDSSPHSSTLTLRDDRGNFHLARATAELPEPGSELEGIAPSLGFTILRGAQTGRMYRVIFELVNTDQHATMTRLEP